MHIFFRTSKSIFVSSFLVKQSCSNVIFLKLHAHKKLKHHNILFQTFYNSFISHKPGSKPDNLKDSFFIKVLQYFLMY